MQTIRFLLLSLTAACVFRIIESADEEQQQAAGDDDFYNDDDAAVADAAYAQDDGNVEDQDYDFYYEEGVDYIQYWTDYAIYPKRCVV